MQGTLDLSAHRLDAWVTSRRHQAPRGDARGRAERAVRRRLRLGREPQADARLVREAGHHAAGRRAGAAADTGQRQRLHPRAVDDARRDRGAAAQRAPRSFRCAEPPRARSRSSCPRAACGKPRGCSTACGRGSRSARCSAIASSACSTRPSSTTAAPWTASSRRCAAWRRSSRAPAAAPTGPVETIAAENVVDGLVLHRRWKEERSAVIAEVIGGGTGHQRPVGDLVDPRQARRRDRWPERRAHRGIGLSDGARQHLAHRQHA